jgi:glycosyltransferase involved in cell wall biosynthesis
MKRLAIITTHPIQYNSPLFQQLTKSKEIQIKVFYTWENSQFEKFDSGFGRKITWDIPLLEGYEYAFIKNVSKKQDSKHFFRIKNPGLNKEISEWKADAILVYGWTFYSHLKAMIFFKGKIPVFFRGDSTLLDEKPGIKSFIRKIVLKCIYSFIDYAFYVGTNNCDYYLLYGLKKDQLFFAPHSIDNKRFANITQEQVEKIKEWKRHLGISEKSIVILFAGKFERKKNPGIILEFAKYIANCGDYSDKSVHFIFIGNGILEDQLMIIASSLTNVHFFPFQNQSDMPLVYRLGDIFVLPSIYNETWGLAVNEAMACGLPVIVSDKVGCAIDLVQNRNAGFCFRHNNFDDFKSILIKFISNIKRGKEMGDFGRESIKEWSIEITANKMIETFIKKI